MSIKDERANGDYRKRKTFETKHIPTFVKAVDEAQGIVQHFVAIMGNLDDGNDIIAPGAFAKTIVENARRVRVLDNHQTDSVLRIIGKPLALCEVGREELTDKVLEYAPEATGALLATTQYALDTSAGRDIFNLIAGGFAPETSIGYDALQIEYEEKVKDGVKIAARRLKEIRLWEYSNVLWGLNPATATVGTKKGDGMAEIKRVVPVQDLPLAARDMQWDGTAAERRVREWAGGDDLDWEQYRRAFMWYDSENPEQFGAYHLQIGDVVDGELVIVPRGAMAAHGALRGSRGATLPYLSTEDRAAVIANLERYYAMMRNEFEDETLITQFESEAETMSKPPTKAMRPLRQCLGDRLEAMLVKLYGAAMTDYLEKGVIGREDYHRLMSLLQGALDMLRAGMPPQLLVEMDLVEMDDEVEYEYDSDLFKDNPLQIMLEKMYGRNLPLEMRTYWEKKSGRVISKASAGKIGAALSALQSAIDALNEMLSAAGAVPGMVEGPEDEMNLQLEAERKRLLAGLAAL